MAERKPTNKAEMMALIDERWTELQSLIGALSPAEFEQPLGDGWSAKVHVGHISVWEASLLALLRGESRAAAMGAPVDLWEQHDTDGINAQIAERAQRWPLANVLKRANEIHREVVETLDGLSDDDLAKSYSHYQPNDPPDNQAPVFGWVNGNTWGHYEEHIGWLRAGLKPNAG